MCTDPLHATIACVLGDDSMVPLLLDDWRRATLGWVQPAQQEAVDALERCFWKLLPVLRAQVVPPRSLASDQALQEARLKALKAVLEEEHPSVVLANSAQHQCLSHDSMQQMYAKGLRLCT